MVISRAWYWVHVAGWGIAERERGLDERGVGEGLRVVAEVCVGGGVHLLAVEADRAGQRQQLLEQFGGFLVPAGAGECLDQPERARQEGALRAGQTSDAVKLSSAVEEVAYRDRL